MSSTPTITSGTWWKAAIIRALRTALVVAAPYVGGASLIGIPWLTVASSAGLGFVLSLLTSLFGIDEAAGATVPWWKAVLERVVKSIAQALIAGIGTATVFQDVHWSTVLQAALIAGFGSLVLAVLAKLPEATVVTPAVPAATVTINNVSSTAAAAAIAQAVTKAPTT